MNKLILWIEISDQQVRFLLRKRRLGKKSSDLLYQSVLYEQEDFLEESKPDFARLEKILKNYRKSIPGNKKIAVYLLLPFQNGLIRRFTLPWIRKRDRDSAIKYHMQYEIPFLAEELVFAYEVIDEKDGEYLNVQVSASKRDGIELYAECLAKAGFVLKGVEYSVWAMGEIFKAESFTKILCLRRYNKQTIELILYKGSVPEVIRKVRVGQADTVKYNVYLSFQDLEMPVDLLITDNSSEVNQLLGLLTAAGMVKEQIAPPLAVDLLPEQGFEAYALLGEMVRVQTKKNINFSQALRPATIKSKAVPASAFLIFLLFLSGIFGYSQIKDYYQIQQEIIVLQQHIEQLHNDDVSNTYTKWKKAHDASLTDLKQVQRALEDIEGMEKGLNVSRWNYRQGTLCLWGDSNDNEAISQLVSNVAADGWKEPVFLNYRLQKESIVFCLSINLPQ